MEGLKVDWYQCKNVFWGDWQRDMIKWTNKCMTFIWIVICHKPFILLRFIFLHHNKYYFLASESLAAEKDLHYTLFLCLPFIFAAGHFFTPSHHFLGIGELVSHHDHKFNNKAVLIIDISFSLLAARCGGHRILLWQRLQLYCGQWTLRLWSEVNTEQCLNMTPPSA